MKRRRKEIPLEPASEEIALKATELSPVAEGQGLTTTQVEERLAAGYGNSGGEVTTKTYGQIFRTNTFTLFNLLVLVLVILVVAVGQKPMEAAFAGPCVINWLIGIIQEIRAKRTIDKLSLISAPRVTVLRDGEEKEIAVHEIVMDDLMVLSGGKQVCSDCVIIEGGCEVNESLITGESDPIIKSQGDQLLSGSFLVSGRVLARVVHVGADNYASKISAGAKYIKSSNSEILRALRTVIKLMSWVVVPLGVLLFLKEFLWNGIGVADSVSSMVASMSSMIPQGLMALSSAVFAVGIMRLSRHKTLSRDLYCIETLARVDVLCLDKTGTITEGSMQVNDVVPVGGVDRQHIDQALITLVDLLPDTNPTYNAIKEFYRLAPRSEKAPLYVAPFSSDRKWSAVSVEGATYVMGAGEFVLKEGLDPYREQLEVYAQMGNRVLVVARSGQILTEHALPSELELIAFVLISDKIRKEAPDTLRYFAEEGVDIRIISGDNPVTVAAIAKQAGLANCEAVDMTTISTDEELVDASRRYKVFGRVTPEQKLKLVKALKADRHTVAMTGDGVNDVLALKEADCSIAMAGGSDAAMNVAQLVLLDSNFASMPRIVAEGRRSINNLQRTASLYLVKTMYSVLLTLLFLFIGRYPFSSNNITLVGSATIGIPSFFLALESNKERVKGHFLQNAISKSLPGAVTILLSFAFLQVLFFFLPEAYALSETQQDMVSVLLLAAGGFFVLFHVCIPFDWKHTLIFVGMVAIFFVGWMFCSVNIHIASDLVLPLKDINLFNMDPISSITPNMGIYIGASIAFCLLMYLLFSWLMRKYNILSGKRMMKALRLEDKA